MNGIVNTLRAAFTKPAYTGLLWLVLRVYVGYEFVTAGWEKLESGKWLGGDGSQIAGFLKGGLGKATGAHPEVQGWYVDLTKHVFLPNAALFQNMVVLGETLVGIALIFGVLTKLSAVCGAMMNLAFVSAGTSSSNPTMLAVQMAVLFAGLGVGYYGIDYFLIPALKKAFHIEPATVAEPVTSGSPATAPAAVR